MDSPLDVPSQSFTPGPALTESVRSHIMVVTEKDSQAPSSGVEGEDVAAQRKAYPLIFKFRNDVYGTGFIARVVTCGRGLMVDEGDAWWLYGVQPGGLAALGATPQQAYEAFRISFKGVLFDIASSVDSYSGFVEKVEEFFNQVDDQELERWITTSDALRAGKLPVEAPFDQLPKKSAKKTEVCLEISNVGEQQPLLSPDYNQLNDPDPILVAA